MDETSPLSAVMDEARGAIRSREFHRAYEILSQRQTQGWDEGQFLEMLGIACCLAGKPVEGLPVLERALDLAPSGIAHFNLGEAHQLLGNYEQARECYKHAIGLDPTYGQAIHALERLRDFEREKLAHEAAKQDDGHNDLHGGPPPLAPPPAEEG